MRLWIRWSQWDTGLCELLSPLIQAMCPSSSPQPRPITTRGIYSCALHPGHTGWFEDIQCQGVWEGWCDVSVGVFSLLPTARPGSVSVSGGEEGGSRESMASPAHQGVSGSRRGNAAPLPIPFLPGPPRARGVPGGF